MLEIESAFVELYKEIADCPRCVLARARTRTVPGVGPASADVMCIGEAPGAREDEQGLPFVGPAGRLLDELLAAAGLSRETVYIANVVKCRPPGNRDPQPDEIEACGDFLDRQIAIVDPLVIVTLGRFSMQRWFPGETIGRIHGRARRADGRVIVPMYHPAAALHRGDLRPVIEADFARVPALVEAARAGADALDAILGTVLDPPPAARVPASSVPRAAAVPAAAPSIPASDNATPTLTPGAARTAPPTKQGQLL